MVHTRSVALLSTSFPTSMDSILTAFFREARDLEMELSEKSQIRDTLIQIIRPAKPALVAVSVPVDCSCIR